MEKVIEVNLGIGMNMFFPEPVKIVIEDKSSDKVEDVNTTENSEK